MPNEIPSYAYELVFSGGDTVYVNNGFEKYPLTFIAGDADCTFFISEATQQGDLAFSMAHDTLILDDASWTGTGKASRFVKAASSAKMDWRFENFLNECVIAGTYMIEKNGKSSPVVFLPNGQVTGLENFLAYELCYAGDCLEETDPSARTILFTNSRGGIDVYVFKMPDGHRLIEFYTIGDPIPDEKGGRTIGPLAFSIKAPQPQAQ